MDDFVDWEMFVVFHMLMLEDLQHRYLDDCSIISIRRVFAFLEIEEDAPDWNIVTGRKRKFHLNFPPIRALKSIVSYRNVRTAWSST